MSAKVPVQELGYSVSQGADWPNYLVYRPIYPVSFFRRIYNYHSQKPQAVWSKVHDIGAGCGIVSSALTSRFDRLIVSDPNDGYTTLARKFLVEDLGNPESKFRFLQEGAEKSSVESGTVDLVAVCECIHWTDPDLAIQEFHRELKVGGTLVITHYHFPRIVSNERAQRAWKGLWDGYSERVQGELFDRAFSVVNTGLECLEFLEKEWETVQRMYINAQGSIESFVMDDRIGESRVKKGEEKVWVENDEDWWDMQEIDWLEGYFATWVPLVPKSEMQDLWDELRLALRGEKVKLETPLVMIFATKKAC